MSYLDSLLVQVANAGTVVAPNSTTLNLVSGLSATYNTTTKNIDIKTSGILAAPTVPTTVTHATTGYQVLSTDTLVRIDCSGGTVSVTFPAAPLLSETHTVANIIGDSSSNHITVVGSAGNIEDPNSLQTFSASVLIQVKGASVTWLWDGTEWVIV